MLYNGCEINQWSTVNLINKPLKIIKALILGIWKVITQ